MTATPRLDSSIAGKYAKLVSDSWYLDYKDTEQLLNMLRDMETEVRIDMTEKVIDNPSLYGLEQ